MARKRGTKASLAAAILFLAAACSGPDAIEIAEEGVGPITGITAFDPDAVSALLPGTTVSRQQVSREGEQYPVILVEENDEKVMEVVPDADERSVAGVIVFSPDIRDGHGIHVGSVYTDIYTEDDKPQCLPGVEEYAGRLFCPAAESTRIYYEIAGKWDGPDGKVPPGDVIGNWRVVAIHWRASAV
ncbi:hypothetical protein FHS78_003207 [Parvibaculum indicum]|uniref:DUF1131 family protein n=1 Tax=Parvibaculum indicum TaxID=562969 RepID=UPI00142455F1|nr:DUF1131 family protein [Parvibaculum indicum]NIJ42899.1 hypothetical protein [Parvibaculum indicum]